MSRRIRNGIFFSKGFKRADFFYVWLFKTNVNVKILINDFYINFLWSSLLFEGVSGEYYDFIILLLQNGGCGIIFNLIFLVNNSVTYERVKTGS